MNLEKILIEHCAPTLAGLKTANLFKVNYADVHTLKVSIDNLNDKFFDKGISFKLVKLNKSNALVYAYRESMLIKDFSNNLAVKILNEFGYKNIDLETSIQRLSSRLNTYKEFPHEIGLFLGYPPEDVMGFICNKGLNCNLCGYWKVYGDTSIAIEKFAKYDKCRAIYKRLWEDGRDIMRLTVKKQLVA